jgi:methylated-DNA-[protein]-cysteine S-methyltransferase
MTTSHTTIDTQMGDLTLVAADGVLTGVYYPGHWTNPDRTTFGPRSDEGFDEVERQFGEYLAGERTAFELRTSATGDTFQQRVWALLNRIPYGETTTYGEIARELGDPALARMVGRAVGSNPLSVIVLRGRAGAQAVPARAGGPPGRDRARAAVLRVTPGCRGVPRSRSRSSRPGASAPRCRAARSAPGGSRVARPAGRPRA